MAKCDKPKKWKLTKKEQAQMENIEDNIKGTLAEVGQLEIQKVQLLGQAQALQNEAKTLMDRLLFKYDIPPMVRLQYDGEKGTLKEVR